MRNIFLFFPITITILGCLSNRPILLDSPLHTHEGVTVNPSLSFPEKGFHPYIGSGIGANGKLITNGGYDASHLDLNLGLLYQSSLEKEWTLGYFSSLSGTMSYSKYTFLPNDDSKKKMSDSEEILFNDKKASFGLDVLARIGLLSKFKIGTFSFYAIGVGQYEDGPYYDYRKVLNEIGNYYNISTDKYSYGYGFGGDLSFGKINEWDTGLIIEVQNINTKTQSYKSDYVEKGSYIVELTDGGSDQIIKRVKTEYYLDIKKIRVSINPIGDIAISFTYRF